MIDYQELEVDWYRRFGNYPAERIRLDGHGRPYVIGDECWNRWHRTMEHIEFEMKREIDADSRRAEK